MENLRPIVFGLIKNLVSGTEERSAKIFGKEIRPKGSGNGQICPSNFEKTLVPLE